jgi:hypothetical protein
VDKLFKRNLILADTIYNKFNICRQFSYNKFNNYKPNLYIISLIKANITYL